MLHGARRSVRRAVGARLLASTRSRWRAFPACASCATAISSAWSPTTSGRRCARRARSRLHVERQRAAAGAGEALATGARRPVRRDEAIVDKGDARERARRRRQAPRRPRTTGRSRRTARSARRARWPTCAPTARRSGPRRRRTHGYRPTFARILGLPHEQVRLVYLDGAGCYGMNGHDDAAADAALLSQGSGKPVRVQWMRAGRARLGSEGPAAAAGHDAPALTPDGRSPPGDAEMWLPRATAGLPNVPLLGPAEPPASRSRTGISTGLITQNADPPYGVANVDVVAHWLKDAPLRPSNIRAPGKMANVLRGRERSPTSSPPPRGVDPLAFRLRDVTDPRGTEVMRRTAALFGWKPRAIAAAARAAAACRGRGFAYFALQAQRELRRDGDGGGRRSRAAARSACGASPARTIAGSIDQSRRRAQRRSRATSCRRCRRTLYEEVAFDRSRVTSGDWASYPILRFADVPDIRVDVVDRPTSRRSARARRPACACRARWRMRSSTRRACACARCRSRPSA